MCICPRYIILILTVIYVAFINTSSYATTNSMCAYGCRCEPSDQKGEMRARCTHSFLPKWKEFTFIPKFPPNVTSVWFSDCKFPNITRQMLKNLTSIKIKDLMFCITGTKHIEKDAFIELRHLKRLEISKNEYLSPDVLKDSLSSLNKSVIDTLRFQYNKWGYVPDDMFDGLAGSNVSIVSITGNTLLSVESRAFSRITKLKKLDLSHNRVLNILSLDKFSKSLYELDLSDNSFVDIPRFCVKDEIMLPTLLSLNMEHNLIRSINVFNYRCLKKLSKLNLSYNLFKKLTNNAFSDLAGLHTLLLMNTFQSVPTIEASAFSSSSLTRLFFNFNRFNFNNVKRYNPDKLFKTCRFLTFLSLEGNILDTSFSIIKKLFLPLQRLEMLVLQKVGMRNFPKGVFQYMPSLRILVLSGNSIVGWSDHPQVFGNITWLNKLVLGGNKIQMVNKTSFPSKMLRTLKYLDLSYNSFSCTCDLMWFRNWIRENKTLVLTNWPRKYHCHSPPSLNKLRLESFNPTEDSCRVPDPNIVVAIILSVVCVTAVIVVGVLYKARWHIRYGIYLLRAKRKGYDSISGNNGDFEYDAFVIYSDENRGFVHERLVPKLEKDNGYQLCIHYRDFDVGRLIADNIIESINKSRKVIAVLSNSFARSEWCHFELKVSQKRFLCPDSEMLIIVMLEEIDNRHLSSSLKSLITTTTYAVWTEDEVGQAQFWDQLLAAIKSQ